HGIAVYTQTIAALEGADNQLEVIRFKDGSHIARRGLFVVSSQRQVPLIHTLGLTLNEEGYVEVDAQQRATDAPMLWAAGDLTSRMQQVLEAAAQGGRAGACINMALTMP
ncbi:MAG: FAD-dependent oxidoreductase, partial [Myxococcota bacterium]